MPRDRAGKRNGRQAFLNEFGDSCPQTHSERDSLPAVLEDTVARREAPCSVSRRIALPALCFHFQLPDAYHRAMLTVDCLRACLEDKPSDHTLDDLWEDTAIRKHLLEISRFTRRRGGRNKKSAKSKSSRALIDLKAVQKIDPPPARTLYQWLNDSTSFPAVESSDDQRPQNLQHAYKATIALEDHNASHVVALRFYHLLFFDVGKRLEPTKKKVNSSLAASVADQLISLGVDKVDLDRIKRWIVVGSIYNDLIEVFGEGCLFFLPVEISFTG
jgi:hypothetical protein